MGGCSWLAAASLLLLLLPVVSSALQGPAGGASREEVEERDANPNSPFNTKYTDWEQKVNYTSSTQFQVRGMEPFYNVTNMVLKWFEPEPTIPEGEWRRGRFFKIRI